MDSAAAPSCDAIWVTPVRLSKLHCTDDGLCPITSQPDGSSYSFQTQSLLVDVELEMERLICYQPLSTSDGSELSGASEGFYADRSMLEVALCLPLQFVAARQMDSGKDHHVLGVIMPEPEAVPSSLRLDSIESTELLQGVWLFNCSTANALDALLYQLQRAGCVMIGFDECYALGETLGVGSFSKVFFAENKRTGCPVAAKIVSKEVGTQSNCKDANLMKEVCVLRRAAHSSVLEFFGVFMGMDPCAGTPVWIIVTEFIGGGELFERVRQEGPLAEDRAAIIIWQLLSALRSLHDRGIVHRDIKTENVILTNSEEDEVKLVDFGLATPVTDKEAMAVRCGTPGYIAPEVLRNEKYGCKIDCFSIGVLAYILVVGRGPFRGKTMEEMLARNMVCKVSLRQLARLSPMGRDLTLRLLNKHAQLRPTAAQALDHSWFQTANLQKLESPLASDAAPKKRKLDANGEQPISSLIVEYRKSIHSDEEPFSPTGAVPAKWSSQTETPQAPAPEEQRISHTMPTAGSDLDSELSLHFRRQSSAPSAGSDLDSGLHLGSDDDTVLEEPAPPPVALLRSQTPVYAEMQAVIAGMRAEGISPRNTTVRSGDNPRRLSETGQRQSETGYVDAERRHSETRYSEGGRATGYLTDAREGSCDPQSSLVKAISEKRHTDRLTVRLSCRGTGRLSAERGHTNRLTARTSDYFTRHVDDEQSPTICASIGSQHSCSGTSLKDLAESDVRLTNEEHEHSLRCSSRLLCPLDESNPAGCEVMDHIFDEMPESYSHGSRKCRTVPRSKNKQIAAGSAQSAARKLRGTKSLPRESLDSEASNSLNCLEGSAILESAASDSHVPFIVSRQSPVPQHRENRRPSTDEGILSASSTSPMSNVNEAKDTIAGPMVPEKQGNGGPSKSPYRGRLKERPGRTYSKDAVSPKSSQGQ